MNQQKKTITELEQQLIQSSPDLKNRMNQPIQENELGQIMTTMSENCGYKEYDYTILEELVEQTRMKFNNRLTPSNFLQIFVEAENILTLKIEHSNQNLNKYQQNCKYLEGTIRELNSRHQQTRNNYSQNNFLILDKISIQNLINPRQETCQPYLQLEIENYQQQIPPRYSSSPIFELNNMQMPIYSFLDQFTILVYDRNIDPYTNQNYLYGKLDVQVDALPFFSNKLVQYKLLKEGHVTQTNIEISCHLEVGDPDRAIADLKQKIQQFQGKIDDIIQENQSLDEQFSSLMQPFKRSLGNGNMNGRHIPGLYDNQGDNYNRNSFQSNQQYQMANNSNAGLRPQQQQEEYQMRGQPVNQSGFLQQQQQQNLGRSPNDITNMSVQSEQNFKNINRDNIMHQQQPFQQQEQLEQQNQFFRSNLRDPQQDLQQQERTQEDQQYHGEQNKVPQRQYVNPYMQQDEDEDCGDIVDWLKRSDIITYGWMILAALICLKRPMFIDILIGFSFIAFLYKGKFATNNYQNLMNFFLGGIAATLALDVIWSIFYVGGWHKDRTSVDQGAESFQRGLIIFLTFANILWKFVVLGSYFLLRNGNYENLKHLQNQFMDSLRNTVRNVEKTRVISPEKAQQNAQYLHQQNQNQYGEHLQHQNQNYQQNQDNWNDY